jgi:hypothetical protein
MAEVFRLFNFINVFRLFIPGLLVFISVILVLICLRRWLQALSARGWPVVQGVITASSVYSYEDEGTMYHSPAITYQYRVDGQLYESDQFAFGSKHHSVQDERGRREAQAVIEQYPVGKQVQVHYQRRDPAEAVLEVRTAGVTTLMAVTLILLAFAGGMYFGLTWFFSQ